jgi:hypothetical protein
MVRIGPWQSCFPDEPAGMAGLGRPRRPAFVGSASAGTVPVALRPPRCPRPPSPGPAPSGCSPLRICGSSAANIRVEFGNDLRHMGSIGADRWSPPVEPLPAAACWRRRGKHPFLAPRRVFLATSRLGDGGTRFRRGTARGGRRKRTRRASIATRYSDREWRLRADGTAIARHESRTTPGFLRSTADPPHSQPANEARLRFINGSRALSSR